MDSSPPRAHGGKPAATAEAGHREPSAARVGDGGGGAPAATAAVGGSGASPKHHKGVYTTRQKGAPDFALLARLYPEFARFVTVEAADVDEKEGGAGGGASSSKDPEGASKTVVKVNWTDPAALRAVTRVLLKHQHGLDWDVPENRLCPTVTLRTNYVRWVRKLLDTLKDGAGGRAADPPLGVDIGTGASAIYALLGHAMHGWRFIATEVDAESAEWAAGLVKRNSYESSIEIRRVEPGTYLCGNLPEAEASSYDPSVPPPVAFTMCNPPFFTSIEQACKNPRTANTGAEVEMVYPGGEAAFVRGIITDSCRLGPRVAWYTTMLGMKGTALELVRFLRTHGATVIQTTEFFQGRTTRWGLAWSFLPLESFSTATLAALGGDPTHIFHSKKERRAREQAFVFTVPLIEVEEVRQRVEEFLGELGGAQWTATSAAEAAAGGEGDTDLDNDDDGADVSFSGEAPLSAGEIHTKNKKKKKKKRKTVEDGTEAVGGGAAKRRRDDDDAEAEEVVANDGKRRKQSTDSAGGAGGTGGSSSGSTGRFRFRVSVRGLSGLTGGCRVEARLVYSLGDARSAYSRFCQQLQADVERTSRKWRRRLARAAGAAGSGSGSGAAHGSGPKVAGEGDPDELD